MSHEITALPKWRLMDAPAHFAEATGLDRCVLWEGRCGLVISRIGDEGSDYYRLEFAPGMVIDVMPSKHIVSDCSKQALTPLTARHLLADQVHPRLIAHEGHLVLHAGAVCADGSAILLMGSSGRGKSTLSASFDQVGRALMGDDAMVIRSVDGTHFVNAVYPSLRLLPDSIGALFPATIVTSAVADYSPKQRVPVATDDNSLSLPIAAVFAIGEPASSPQIRLRRLSIASACMHYVENSFALDPSDTSRARQRMEQASALARQVPAFEITYPRDYARLPEVRQAILDQIAELEPA